MSLNLKLYDSLDPSVTSGLSIYSVLDAGNSATDSLVKMDLDKLSISTTKLCTYCQASFSNASEQRAHYKLDWHRYNLKQALFNRPSISMDDFDKTAGDVSSISGSESDSSLDEEEQEAEDRNKIELEIRDARMFWKNSQGEVFSIYKSLLLGRRESPPPMELLPRLYNFIKTTKKWLLVMLGGGHFAAAVFDGATVRTHKTFHCYTVRAKQGGGQASRDAKGGNAPKSAGASLRRYNEMALIQHVQEIMTAWADDIAQCSLILYRAVGPHNRAVLFGGKTPPFSKLDPRLRPIPFATRRATFKEVKRVHDILSTIQCHGTILDLEKHVKPAERQASPRLKKPKNAETKKSGRNVDRGKERVQREREIPWVKDGGSSQSEEETGELCVNDMEIDLGGLKEFDSSIKRKRRKLTSKQKANLVKKKVSDEMAALLTQLVDACRLGDADKLQSIITSARTWPTRLIPEKAGENTVEGATDKTDKSPEEVTDKTPEKSTETLLKREDFEECLREGINEDNDTLLHIASSHSQPKIVTILLNSGSDPTVKNRKKLVPYVVSGDKDTKTAFKVFAAEFPGKFDAKLTMIPPPLTEEQEQMQNEKKKERRKIQKEREKQKKIENEKKKTEEDERIRYLTLSDREKRALAAERRLIKSVTANSAHAAPPVLVRCFLCGIDITGKVPFEYNSQLFCSMVCLKSHRAQNK